MTKNNAVLSGRDEEMKSMRAELELLRPIHVEYLEMKQKMKQYESLEQPQIPRLEKQLKIKETEVQR